MAIAIQGLTIVVRLDRAAELLPGGIEFLTTLETGRREATSISGDVALWRMPMARHFSNSFAVRA